MRRICSIFFGIVYAFCSFHTIAQMRVHMINVGQGCAALVEFPCGAILIDAGGESNSLFNSSDELKAYLDEFFDRRTDLNHTFECVYLTHPHKDHTGGVPIILQPPYKIKNVVTDGLERGSGKVGQKDLHRMAQDSEANSDTDDDVGLEAVTSNMTASSGLSNSVIDPVSCSGTDPVIRILWGTSVTKPGGWNNSDFENENNHSLVIRIDYGASSALFTGDLEDKAQHNLVSKYQGTSLLDVDLYVVGHHGSKNGSSQELLNKITPKMALLGVGDPARKVSWTAWAHGHPNVGILDRLQGAMNTTRPPIHIKAGTGAKTFQDYTLSKAIYATAWDGNVVLQAEASGNWQKIQSTIVPALVNLNTATVDQLEPLPGIGHTKAQAIVDYRSTHGHFSVIDDLDKVQGIGKATINLLRPYVQI